jgi:hypothetical protein
MLVLWVKNSFKGLSERKDLTTTNKVLSHRRVTPSRATREASPNPIHPLFYPSLYPLRCLRKHASKPVALARTDNEVMSSLPRQGWVMVEFLRLYF